MFASDKPDNSTAPLGLGPRPSTREASLSESYNAALSDTYLNESAIGAVSTFSRSFNALRDDLVKSGYEDLSYLDMQRAGYLIDKLNGKEPNIALYQPEEIEYLDGYISKLKKLNQDNPEIPTLQGLWEKTRQQMIDADAVAKNVGDKNGFAGVVGSLAGGFVGHIGAGLEDPVRGISLFFGGAGKNVVQRIGSEIAVNTLVEGMEQFTTIEENRRLAGLEKGWEQKASDALLAGAFAGAFRGIAMEAPRAVIGQVRESFNQLPIEKKIEVLDKMPQTSKVRASREALVAELDAQKASPFSPTRQGEEASRAALRSVVERSPELAALARGVSYDALMAGAPKVIPEEIRLDPVIKSESVEQAKILEYDVEIQTTQVRQDKLQAKINVLEQEIFDLQNLPQTVLAKEIDPNIQKTLDEVSVAKAETPRKQKKLDARKDAALETLAEAESLRATRVAELDKKKSKLQGEFRENQRKISSLKQRKTKAIKKAERKLSKVPRRTDQDIVNQATSMPHEPIPSILDVFGEPRALSDVLDPLSHRGKGVARAAQEMTEESKLRLEALEKSDIPQEIDGMIDFGDGPIPADTKIPVASSSDGEVTFMTAREMIEDMAEDQRLVEVLEACPT